MSSEKPTYNKDHGAALILMNQVEKSVAVKRRLKNLSYGNSKLQLFYDTVGLRIIKEEC